MAAKSGTAAGAPPEPLLLLDALPEEDAELPPLDELDELDCEAVLEELEELEGLEELATLELLEALDEELQPT